MNHNNRKRLFAVLSNLGLGEKEQRATVIFGFTNGRTDSSKDLSDWEEEDLIRHLEDPQYEACNKMRRKMISRAYEMRWGNPHTQEGKREAVRKINDWCKESGYKKKEFNAYTYDELPTLVSQFEEIYKWFLSKI